MITSVNPDAPKMVFISFSEADRQAQRELRKFLQTLIDERRIKVWSEELVAPGSYVKAEMLQAIDEAEIALLILTADYLSSQDCRDQREKIVKAQLERGLRILPIVWSACDWEEFPLGNGHRLGELRPLPLDRHPVQQAEDRRNSVLTAIAQEIRQLTSVTRAASAPAPAADVTPSQRSSGALASAVSAPSIQLLPSSSQNQNDPYVCVLESDATVVDILDLVERLKQSEPKSWLWTGGAFRSLTKGRGDKGNPDRLLRVSWTPKSVVVEMNPVGFIDGHPRPDISHNLVRSSSKAGAKKYCYYPYGKSQPYRYEVDVRFGDQIAVLITDISSKLPDLKRSPALQLIWSGVGNQGGTASE